MSESSFETEQEFMIEAEHRRWAKSAARKYGRSISYWIDLIKTQNGRCAFSGAKLRFDAASGTAQAGGPGVHPIYAAVDHCSPGCDVLGHEIVSYDLNDLKGHLPPDCFADLRECPSWKRLMENWRRQADQAPEDRAAFLAVRRGTA
jgi:hypothetical protein